MYSVPADGIWKILVEVIGKWNYQLGLHLRWFSNQRRVFKTYKLHIWADLILNQIKGRPLTRYCWCTARTETPIRSFCPFPFMKRFFSDINKEQGKMTIRRGVNAPVTLTYIVILYVSLGLSLWACQGLKSETLPRLKNILEFHELLFCLKVAVNVHYNNCFKPLNLKLQA